jgi:hypothetical protein
MTFPNGSVIYLEGADAKEASMDRFLGQKLQLAVVDEASKFRVDVERLVFNVLKPALADLEGQLVMIGTTTDFINSYFARATQGRIGGWSIHKWSALDNPHLRRQFLSDIQALKANNPLIEKEAWFRQEYLAEWVVNTKSLVYKYEPEDCVIAELPSQRWSYSLGITLSYTGRSAFSVLAYSSKSRAAYVVETLAYQDTSIFRALETVENLRQSYDFSSIVCAEASKRLVDELRTRFGLAVKEAPEKDKPAIIRLFTSELEMSHIKVITGNKDLLIEWDSIILDTRTSNSRANLLREHPVCENQLATATLYAWHNCFNYAYQPKAKSDDPADKHWSKIEEGLENGREEDDFRSFYGIPGDDF